MRTGSSNRRRARTAKPSFKKDHKPVKDGKPATEAAEAVEGEDDEEELDLNIEARNAEASSSD